MSILKDEPRMFWIITHLILFLLAMIWTAVFHDSMPNDEWRKHYSMVLPYVMGIGFTTLGLHGIILMATKSK